MKTFAAFLSILLLCLALPVRAQEATAAGDSAQVPAIDPLDHDAGDFLDTSLRELERRAYDAYQAGDYKDAAGWYLELLNFNITDASSIYNLACCYGLIGEPELAALYLRRSFRAGFDDLEHARQDPDFANVRGKEVFDRVVDSLALAVQDKRKGLGQLLHVQTPVFLESRVRLPGDFDPDKVYPLLVGLHGYGSSHESFVGLWDRMGDSPDFIYAAPQAPYPFGTGNELGYSWGLRVEDKELGRKARTESEEYVIRTVRELGRRYNIGEIYLLGFSQGCGMAYTTGIRNHGLFRGLICFGGWLDEEWLGEAALEAAKDLRVFICHGKEDRAVEFESGTKARDRLTRLDYDVTFVEFDGGHRVPEEQMKQAIAWMRSTEE